MLFIAPEPKILVSIDIDDGQLIKISLSLAEGFLVVGIHTGPLLKWLQQYAKKKPSQLPFELEKGKSFTNQVHKALTQIPFGEKTNYQNLAKILDNPKGSRAVGNACGSNPYPLFIPCHRGLRKDGKMGGFSCGVEIKRRLLAFEGS